MDPSVATLQSAVNRFAVVGGFPRLDVDGAWGPRTRQGVYSSLAFIGQGKCYQNACPESETSRTAAGIMTQWDETPASAKGIAEFLGGVANELGMPHVPSPIVGGGGGGFIPPSGKLPPSPFTPISASLVDRFKMLSTWQQVAFGVIAGLGLIWAANRFKKA